MTHPQGPRTPDQRHLAAIAQLVGELQPAIQRRDRRRQALLIGKLADLRAPMGEQWQALAGLALGCGEVTLARRAMALFVDGAGNTPMARYMQAGLLEQCGALPEALAIMRELPAHVPDPAGHAYSLGAALLFLGERDEARGYLEQAVRLEPAHGAAWLSLAAVTDLAADRQTGDRLLDAARHVAQAPARQQAPWWHAAGQVHHARGDHAAAFAAFSQGNAATRSYLPNNREASLRNARSAIDGWDSAAIARLAARQAEPTGRAIFVTGLPRSGTTLVEQILASHSAVSDGAEIGRLPLLAGEVGGNSLAAVEAHVARHGAGPLAQYWAHLLAERFGPQGPDGGRVVDKSLDTSRLAGLAAALLPQAPLVWLVRDPLDCAWSCFRTHFPAHLPWSTDLADIAFQFAVEEALRAHWQEVLGERLLLVPLEKLAADPAAWTRRILAHCGLPEEPQVLAPHETRRAVTSASAAQVRQPVSSTGVGSAAPYRAMLEPFLRAREALPPAL